MTKLPSQIEIMVDPLIMPQVQRALKAVSQDVVVRAYDGSIAMGMSLRCGDESVDYAQPVRLGRVIDDIDALRKRARGVSLIPLGDGMCDVAQGCVTYDDGSFVSLTDKEVEMLVYLYTHRDAPFVSRKSLLDDVWGYAEGVETHTLETHIYRLRQKIERDPSTPSILITVEATGDHAGGYCLA